MNAVGESSSFGHLAWHLRKVQHRPSAAFCLDVLDFSVPCGEVVAVVGHNGAGKSTLFDLMTLQLLPGSGEMMVAGKTPHAGDLAPLRAQVGYLPQQQRLPPWSCARDVLDFAARIYGLPQVAERVREALARWGLANFATRPLGQCSHGMVKRVGLALANLANPPLMVLDEPFTGLDILFIKEVEDLLEARRGRGQTTVFSSHLYYFVAKCADAVHHLERGRLNHLAMPEQRDVWISFLENTVLSARS